MTKKKLARADTTVARETNSLFSSSVKSTSSACYISCGISSTNIGGFGLMLCSRADDRAEVDKQHWRKTVALRAANGGYTFVACIVLTRTPSVSQTLNTCNT